MTGERMSEQTELTTPSLAAFEAIADQAFAELPAEFLECCGDLREETLKDVIAHVLIHEIGHHFGLSDARMKRIESTDSA